MSESKFINSTTTLIAAIVGVAAVIGSASYFTSPKAPQTPVIPKVEFVQDKYETTVMVEGFHDQSGLVRVRDKELGNVCYYTNFGRAISCVNDISLNTTQQDANWTTINNPE